MLKLQITYRILFLSIKKTKNKSSNQRPLIRIFSDKNINKFKTDIADTDWEDLLNIEDTNDAYDIFYNRIFQIYEANFPLKRMSRKRVKDKPWMTKGLKKSINRRNELYRKKCRNPTQENINKLKIYRNILSSCLEQAEITYYNDIFSDKQTGIKAFWKTYGFTLNPKKKKKFYSSTKTNCRGSKYYRRSEYS